MPTLIDSNSVSSLDETPPLSPFGFDFPHQSRPSSTQPLALPDDLHSQLENSHEAWWSRSAGRSSSNPTCAIDSSPQKEPVKHFLVSKASISTFLLNSHQYLKQPCETPKLMSYGFPRPHSTITRTLSLLDDTPETEVSFDIRKCWIVIHVHHLGSCAI